MKKVIFIILILASLKVTAQNNSIYIPEASSDSAIAKLSKQLDSLHLKVRDIIVTGNFTTKEYIVVRELELQKGTEFTAKKYFNSLSNLLNLNLFSKVTITPVPVADNGVTLNIEVEERPYFVPVPGGGVEEGEYFKKLYAALTLRFDNIRGRNETLILFTRFFYNPEIRLTFRDPWFAGKSHLFTLFNTGWKKHRNQSIRALGIANGQNTIKYEVPNFTNYITNIDIIFGKYFGRYFSIFADAGYNHLRVSEYAPGRTFNSSGIDKFLNLGIGAGYDSRDYKYFASKGWYLHTTFTRFGIIDKLINYGRFDFESQTFIPISFSKDYYITIASRLFTSLSVGAIIPVYDHQFLGYSDNYVRGWSGKAYEGDDELTAFNEIRIPIYKPRYTKGSKIFFIQDVPVLRNMNLLNGLFATIIYDIGTTFDHTDRISKQRFLSGAGIGLDAVLPFGLVGRADWVFRLGHPIVGQVGFSLSAKF